VSRSFHITLLLGLGFAAPAWAQDPLVRVKLSQTIEPLVISGVGLRFQGGTGGATQAERDILKQLPAGTAWKITCDRRSSLVQVTPIGIPLSHPAAKGIALKKQLQVDSSDGVLFLQKKPYRAALRIHATPGQGGCLVVNELPLENYLEGVVNHEFSSKWAPTAVEAQVIAARTYALYQLKESKRTASRLYDIESTEKDQVYGGQEKVDSLATQAVQRTRGKILVPKATPNPSPKGWITRAQAAPVRSPLKAYYHSTCGGATELPEAIWGQKTKGFYRTVKCEWCGDSPRAAWRTTVRPDELAQAFRQNPSQRLVELKIRKGSLRGRVERLSLKWFDAQKKTASVTEVSAHDFRMALGPSRVQSTWFSLSGGIASGFMLEGRGYGHGVGLCQWGAKNLGAQGKTAAQILSHYYPDSVLVQAW
jgi:stage II sporulation protein D